MALMLNDTQRAHAQAMVREVQAYGLNIRAAVIVIETALVESNILVFANPNVPESMSIPHDAVGSDHASVGPLQQQVPMWGTARDCMDPAASTRKFLDRLVRFNWESMPTGEAAQRVQVSAFPDRYQQRESEAIQIVNALWGEIVTPAEIDAVATAVVKKLMTWDVADGPAVAPFYKVVVNTQAAVAAVETDVAALKADVDAIKKKDGA
jgi:hypothetical protein